MWILQKSALQSFHQYCSIQCQAQVLCNVYGVALVSRIDEIVGLVGRILSLIQGSFAKETYSCIDPTNQSHPISKSPPNTWLNISLPLQIIGILKKVRFILILCIFDLYIGKCGFIASCMKMHWWEFSSISAPFLSHSHIYIYIWIYDGNFQVFQLYTHEH